jgi:hypothetical protein
MRASARAWRGLPSAGAETAARWMPGRARHDGLGQNRPPRMAVGRNRPPTPRHPGLVPGSTQRRGASPTGDARPPTASPQPMRASARAWRGLPSAGAETAARWMPGRARHDGLGQNRPPRMAVGRNRPPTPRHPASCRGPLSGEALAPRGMRARRPPRHNLCPQARGHGAADHSPGGRPPHGRCRDEPGMTGWGRTARHLPRHPGLVPGSTQRRGALAVDVRISMSPH